MHKRLASLLFHPVVLHYSHRVHCFRRYPIASCFVVVVVVLFFRLQLPLFTVIIDNDWNAVRLKWEVDKEWKIKIHRGEKYWKDWERKHRQIVGLLVRSQLKERIVFNEIDVGVDEKHLMVMRKTSTVKRTEREYIGNVERDWKRRLIERILPLFSCNV